MAMRRRSTLLIQVGRKEAIIRKMGGKLAGSFKQSLHRARSAHAAAAKFFEYSEPVQRQSALPNVAPASWSAANLQLSERLDIHVTDVEAARGDDVGAHAESPDGHVECPAGGYVGVTELADGGSRR